MAAWHEWKHLEDAAVENFEAAGGGDVNLLDAFCRAGQAGLAADRNNEALDRLVAVDNRIRSISPMTLAGWLVRLRVERDEQRRPWEEGAPLIDLDHEPAMLHELYNDLAAAVARSH